jgi:hypothetical protein
MSSYFSASSSTFQSLSAPLTKSVWLIPLPQSKATHQPFGPRARKTAAGCRSFFDAGAATFTRSHFIGSVMLASYSGRVGRVTVERDRGIVAR